MFAKAIASLALLAAALGTADAQVSGYLFRATGPRVASTSLTPPEGYPFQGGVPIAAPSPNSVGLPVLPSLGTYTKDGFAALGSCYCTPESDGESWCFRVVTTMGNFQTTSADCDPPLDYQCQAVSDSPAVFSQISGPAYRCSTISPGPGPQPSNPLPGATPQQTNYVGVFRANNSISGNYRTSSTPVLGSGQQLFINPKPLSLGLQIEGIDITMNGNLNGLPLEPPNPAVCVGNGFVMEVTNDVLIAYDSRNGSVVAGPTDFQHFFGVYGPPYNGLSDPYCLYDAADSKRFYVSMSYFSCRSPACQRKGSIPIFSYLLVGVSKTSDPRDGWMGPYFIATDGINPDTNQPYPNFEGCGTAPASFTGKGCLGDFPNPGMDKHGFWFAMNMFTINGQTLLGANVFGVRKADLLSGNHSNPSVVTYTHWDPYPGFTIVPSITQATSNHSSALGGSIYLMSSDSFSYTGKQQDSEGIPSIRSWAITNTSLLERNFPGDATPTLQPPVTLLTQPLQFTDTAFKNLAAPSGTSVPQPSGPTVSAQEERMRQVSYSGGYLYSCFQTPVNISGRVWDGLAYFVLRPNFTSGGLYNATIVDQGYIAIDGAHLLNGAFTSAPNGSAVIAGSIIGNGMYLSAFYAHITPRFGPGPIHVPKVSRDPLLNEGPGQLPQRRTGDYTVATLDEAGNVWVVAQWASDKYTNLKQPDSGNPRRANWGTWIMEVNPYMLD